MSMSQDARCPECGTLHAGPGEYESYTTSPGQADVPFGCAELTHTYMLRTYGGHGPGASDTLVITAGVPQIDNQGSSTAAAPPRLSTYNDRRIRTAGPPAGDDPGAVKPDA